MKESGVQATSLSYLHLDLLAMNNMPHTHTLGR